MTKYIKSFLSIILFTLVFNGCSNKSNMFRAAYDNRCANFMLNVYPTYSDQGPGQGITLGGNINRGGLSSGGIRLGGQSIFLQVQFQVRRIYSSGRGFNVTGQGKATNFDIGVEGTIDRFNIPVRYDHEAYRPGSAHKLVQDAVRDGFERLREVLRNEYEPWKGLVSDVTPDGHITIQTEPGDNFRSGDVFRVFPIGGPNMGGGGYNNPYGGGYNNNSYGGYTNHTAGGMSAYHPSCTMKRGGTQQSIAIARLVEADEFSSILEIASDQTGGQRPVQIGDFVESVIPRNESDEDERRRISARKVMRLGFVRPFLLRFQPRPNSRYYNRPVDLTAFLESAVLTEAPNYGFDIIL